MRRVYAVVEGQTEEQFARHVLRPHLINVGVDLRVQIVQTSVDPRTGAKVSGGGHWRHWRRDLLRLLREQPADVRVTTFHDLYGLPGDFPGMAKLGRMADTRSRVAALEQAMKDDVGDDRLIPYLQRHEFEALLFADLTPLRSLLYAQTGLEALQREVAGLLPEDINDGSETAPSKRLIRYLGQEYRSAKAAFGQLVTETTGLSRIREACPRFNDWITSLEGLGSPSQ